MHRDDKEKERRENQTHEREREVGEANTCI